MPGLEPADLEAPVGVNAAALLRAIPAPLAAGEGETILVATTDASGFADGAVTSKLAWPALVDPEPKLRINAGGQGLVLDEGNRVRIRANGKELVLAAELTDDIPAAVAAVSVAFPETRALFHCQREAGAIRMVPALAKIEVQPAASRTGQPA